MSAPNVDPFSPQTPITDNGAKASSWFQRWLGNVSGSLVAPALSFVPSSNYPGIANVCEYRQLGDLVYFNIRYDFIGDGVIGLISLSLPTTAALLDSHAFYGTVREGVGQNKPAAVWSTDGINVLVGNSTATAFAATSCYLSIGGMYKV